MTGTSTTVDTKMKLTQTEALLAVMVEHLEQQVSTLRFALGAALIDLGARSRPESRAAEAMNELYPEHIELEDGRLLKNFQAPLPPFPPYWLGQMARTGRSLAQVSGKSDAVERVERALATK